jgi:hypothetical protein
VLRRLRVVAHFHGRRQLRVTVLHAIGRSVLVRVRVGKRVVLRRRVKVRGGTAKARVSARRKGLYRVTALDPGPPLRSARAKRRIR